MLPGSSFRTSPLPLSLGIHSFVAGDISDTETNCALFAYTELLVPIVSPTMHSLLEKRYVHREEDASQFKKIERRT